MISELPPEDRSRRRLLSLLGATAALPLAGKVSALLPQAAPAEPRPCRIRTLTAGIALDASVDFKGVDAALAMLARGKERFETEGYEVETTRIATTPFIALMTPAARGAHHVRPRDRDA